MESASVKLSERARGRQWVAWANTSVSPLATVSVVQLVCVLVHALAVVLVQRPSTAAMLQQPLCHVDKQNMLAKLARLHICLADTQRIRHHQHLQRSAQRGTQHNEQHHYPRCAQVDTYHHTWLMENLPLRSGLADTGHRTKMTKNPHDHNVREDKHRSNQHL